MMPDSIRGNLIFMTFPKFLPQTVHVEGEGKGFRCCQSTGHVKMDVTSVSLGQTLVTYPRKGD